MTHEYKKFQNMLRELESKLGQVRASSGDHHHHHHHRHHDHQSLLDHNHLHHHDHQSPLDHNPSLDFKQRLAFFKTLLQAEIASKEPAKPDHLIDMCQKVDELEAAFRAGSKTASSENSSACSCTDSCVNDDGEVENDNDNDSSYPVHQHLESIDQVTTTTATTSNQELLSDEENKLTMVEFDEGSLVDRHETTSVKAVEYLDCVVRESIDDEEDDEDDDEERVDVKSEERGSSIGGAVASGMVLGMALMGFAMLTFSGCFQYGHNHHYGNFLTPT